MYIGQTDDLGITYFVWVQAFVVYWIQYLSIQQYIHVWILSLGQCMFKSVKYYRWIFLTLWKLQSVWGPDTKWRRKQGKIVFIYYLQFYAVLYCVIIMIKKFHEKNSGTPFSGNEKFKYKLVEYNYDAPNFQ